MLDELLQGQSNRQIGRNLFISEDTVKSHVKAILRKLGARDRAHAVSLVLSNRAARAAPAARTACRPLRPSVDAEISTPRSESAADLRPVPPATHGPAPTDGGRPVRPLREPVPAVVAS